jgi:hypothetical protein
MKKVYQTIIDPGHGNCMQAVVASLFEMDLDQVPNFIELGDRWFMEFRKFFIERGYEDPCSIHKYRHGTERLRSIAKFDGGVNGFFYATVNSKLFEDRQHAVIVDTDLNVVHDPNPNEIYLSCTPEDVESILVLHDMVIGKTGKCFTGEEWRNASEEEREANTYRVGEMS